MEKPKDVGHFLAQKLWFLGMPESQCNAMLVARKVSCVLQRIFDRIKGNLAEIQPKNHQNVQKTNFLQKVPGVNGLR